MAAYEFNAIPLTLAGTGVAGFADGAGSVAQFSPLYGDVTVDGAGNAYIADTLNNRIRKITPSGTVSTLAGSGVQGFADGAGSAAKFNNPTGVSVDNAGNVYVADYLNNRIRKITPNGTVSTLSGTGVQGFADGAGNVAQFSQAAGLTVDSAGNVYVTDLWNHRIRKITPNGTVSTLAGSGIQGFSDGAGSVAQFNLPAAISVDNAGNLYVADQHNHRIRKVTPSGTVSTLAGTGVAGSADGAGSAAQFNLPAGISVDSYGNVYVSDTYGHRIRKITPSGTVSTIAGTGVAGFADGAGNVTQFNKPYGLGLDGAGNLYVVDSSNNRIRKITFPNLPPVPAAPTISKFVGATGSSQIAANDPNTGDTFTYAVTKSALHGTATVDAYGLATYTPNKTYTGADTFDVTVTDQIGATGTVTVQVGAKTTPMPTAPTISKFVGTTGSSQIAANDPNTGDTFTYAVTKSALHGTATVDAYGLATYTPNKTYTGADTFDVTVTDQIGVTGVVTVQVLTNHAPVPTASKINTAFGTAATSKITPNDPDPGNTFTYAVTKAALHGTAVVDTYGLATYTPNKGFAGTDSFTVSVTDQTGAIGSVQLQVLSNIRITVPVNLSISSLDANKNSAKITQFLQSATAPNFNLNGKVIPTTVTNDAPNTFPIGTTTVTFRAIDPLNNVKIVTSSVTVSAAHIGLEKLSVKATNPANVTIQFRAFDSITGKPLTTLKSSYFQVKQDNLPLTVESYFEVKKAQEIKHRIDTVLMLDISSSVTPANLIAMKKAAKAVFLDANGNSLLLKDQRVAIYAFDNKVTLIQDFTSNPRTLALGIDSIIGGGASTNLYGAIVTGMARLTTTSSASSLIEGNMILLTDGRDTSAITTLGAAKFSIGMNKLHVIGVTGFDVASIQSLTPNYSSIKNYSQVTAAMQTINQEIQDRANAFYQVLYVTPARAGSHTVQLTVKGNKNTAINNTITGTFSAVGFVNPTPQPLIKGLTEMVIGSSIDLQAITRLAAVSPTSYTWSIDNPTLASMVSSPYTSLMTLTAKAKGLLSVTLKDTRYPNTSYVHQVLIDDLVLSHAGNNVSKLTLNTATPMALSARTLAASTKAPLYKWSIANPTIASLDYTSGSNVTVKGLKGGTTQLLVKDLNTGVSSLIPITILAIDTTPPVITVKGNTTVTVTQGQNYVDMGATALDKVDGNLTNAIVINNAVNTSVIGNYTVTYNVSDAAGNAATPAIRTVQVRSDALPPVLSLTGSPVITVLVGGMYKDPGATAMDNIDGNITAKIATVSTIKTAIAGHYLVTYDVSDVAGNAAAQLVRDVYVITPKTSTIPDSAVQIPLTGAAASVEVHSAGQSLSSFSAQGVQGTPPAGVSVPFGVISYTTTVPVGVLKSTVNLSFSQALPASFVAYKVDAAGSYTIIPQGTGVDQWKQIDAKTIALTLSDGGQFDLDGAVNGVIIDPIAIAVPATPNPPVVTTPTPAAVPATSNPPVATTPTPAASSGGGCVISTSKTFDPMILILLLFAIIGLVKNRKTLKTS